MSTSGLLQQQGRTLHGGHRLVVLLLQVHGLHGHLLHGGEAQVQSDDHSPRGAPRHDACRSLALPKVSAEIRYNFHKKYF